jgi:hypothetical protein
LGFKSARGTMLAYVGRQFELVFPYLGILPGIPHLATDSTAILTTLLDEFAKLPADLRLPVQADTYWGGKAICKVADVIMVAESIGRVDVRDQLLSESKSYLSDWFEATGNDDKRFFYYDERMGSIIG